MIKGCRWGANVFGLKAPQTRNGCLQATIMLCMFVFGVMDAAVPRCCVDPVTVTRPIRQPGDHGSLSADTGSTAL